MNANGYFFFMYSLLDQELQNITYIYYFVYLFSTFLFISILINYFSTKENIYTYNLLYNLNDSNPFLAFFLSILFFSIIGLPISLFFMVKIIFLFKFFNYFVYSIVFLIYFATIIQIVIFIKFISSLYFYDSSVQYKFFNYSKQPSFIWTIGISLLVILLIIFIFYFTLLLAVVL
jgi:NADH:ubiquinone oxidoreductase subunit 2 (subunit N)